MSSSASHRGEIAGPSDASIMSSVSDAASHDDYPRGSGLLPRDLSEAELAAAPVLATVDALLIDDLTAGEDEAFGTALSS
jgi:hypothetical protein